MRVITNNVPRLLIDAYELSDRERAEFDYIDWNGVEEGRESATFFRYRGQLYDLGEFVANMRETGGGTTGRGDYSDWDGYMTDSFFSAIVVRYVADDDDRVVVGLALA